MKMKGCLHTRNYVSVKILRNRYEQWALWNETTTLNISKTVSWIQKFQVCKTCIETTSKLPRNISVPRINAIWNNKLIGIKD